MHTGHAFAMMERKQRRGCIRRLRNKKYFWYSGVKIYF
jgi:hypothetical protein